MTLVHSATVIILAIAAPAVAGIKVEPANPCACLNWKDAYAHHGASCGHTGREVASMPRQRAPPGFKWLQGKKTQDATDDDILQVLGPMLCTSFFEQIDDNMCVNWDYNAANNQGLQWCYVSSACPSLGVGQRVRGKYGFPTKLAVKSCTANDRMSRTMSPLQVAEIADRSNLDLSILLKWSFPVLGEEQYMGLKDLDFVSNSPIATIWNSEEDRPPYLVVDAYDKAEYKVQRSPASRIASNNIPLGKAFALNCTIGC